MAKSFLDADAVREFCWRTCDSDPGNAAYAVDLVADIPPYSHEETRSAFVNEAAFFGCVDNCEFKEFDEKLIAVLVPSAVVLLAVFILVLVCAFNKACWLNRVCAKRRKKSSFVTSEATSKRKHPPGTSSLNSTASSTLSAEFKTHSPPFFIHQSSLISQISMKEEDAKRSSRSRKKSKSVTEIDFDASIRSAVSVNSWIVKSKDKKKRSKSESPIKRAKRSLDERRKGLMDTATKLGKRLVDLDKSIDERRRRRRREVQLQQQKQQRHRRLEHPPMKF